MRIPLLLGVGVLMAVFPCEAGAFDTSKKLSGAQIRAAFAGMELTDDVHWRDVYERDGSLRSYSDGKGRVGKWTVKKDELCTYFKEPDDGCYEVSLSGDRIEMKPSGLGLSIEGILQAPTDRN
jgi:hypothetical protein